MSAAYKRRAPPSPRRPGPPEEAGRNLPRFRRDAGYDAGLKGANTTVAVALHIDAAELKKPEQSPEGYLRVEGVIATPGILPYHRGGNVVCEYVPESTLRDPEWLKSLEGKPVVIEHPNEELVGPENVGRLEVGTVYDVRWDDQKGVVAKIILKHEAGIKAFREKGFQELSPAYEASTSNESGRNKYGEYDVVQTKRRAANHVALTKNARAGRAASIRTDSKYGEPWVQRSDQDDQAEHDDDSPSTDTEEIQVMPRINFDGMDIEVEDTRTAQVINEWRKDQKEDMDELEGELQSAKEKIQKLKERKEKIEAQLETFRSALGMDDGETVESPEDINDMMGGGDKNKNAQGSGGGSGGGGGNGKPAGKGDGGNYDSDDGDTREDSRSFEEKYQERRKLERCANTLRMDSVDEGIAQDEFKRKVINAYFGDQRADSKDGVELDATFETVAEILEQRSDARDDSLQEANNQIGGPQRNDSGGADQAEQDYANSIYD